MKPFFIFISQCLKDFKCLDVSLGIDFYSFLRRHCLSENVCLHGSGNHAVDINYQRNLSLKEWVTNEGHGMAMELVAGSAAARKLWEFFEILLKSLKDIKFFGFEFGK